MASRTGKRDRCWRAAPSLQIAIALVGFQTPASACILPDPVAVLPTETASPQVEISQAKLIVALGDSLFSGYHLPQEQGFAPTLQRALIADGIPAQVVNAGVAGDTSAQGLRRLYTILDGLDRKPDIVIVGLGANDMFQRHDPAVPRANLEAILIALKDRGIPAMLTGSLALPSLPKKYAAGFDAIYPRLALKYDVPLYPFFLQGILDHPDLMLPDGAHPSAQGVAEITRRILPTVKAALAAH